MNAEADLDRRVTRVENELVHIYDLIDERTNAIQATLDGHARTLDEHGRILNEHGRILNEHGRILNEILRRLPEPTA